MEQSPETFMRGLTVGLQASKYNKKRVKYSRSSSHQQPWIGRLVQWHVDLNKRRRRFKDADDGAPKVLGVSNWLCRRFTKTQRLWFPSAVGSVSQEEQKWATSLVWNHERTQGIKWFTFWQENSICLNLNCETRKLALPSNCLSRSSARYLFFFFWKQTSADDLKL